MARRDRNDDEPGLSESERSHLVHRDRKRVTRMVVDNAGIKRVLGAVSRRRAQLATDDGGSGSKDRKPPSG